ASVLPLRELPRSDLLREDALLGDDALGRDFPALRSFTAFISCGPSRGLHSMVAFSFPAIIASKAPFTASIDTITMSLPGLRPASSIAWMAPIAMSSLWA